MHINIRSFVVAIVGLMFLGIASSASADNAKWRVATGSARSSVRCDEIGDVVIGGEDGKTPIYSCRNGEDWQAVKGSQAYTPRCKSMDRIWWSSENRSVMYTCTSGAIFIGNQPQPADGPWKMDYVDGEGYVCGYVQAEPGFIRFTNHYANECPWSLINQNHRDAGRYQTVKPRRFPDGVVELSFEWTPPATAVPAESDDPDVEVIPRSESSRSYGRGLGLADLGISRRSAPPRIRMFGSDRSQPIPVGMPSADPTSIPGEQDAVVSCGNQVVTHYLLAKDAPVWIDSQTGSVRVCTGKTFGKSWQSTWDLAVYDDGTSSYFAGSADGNWRLVHGSVEATAFGNIRWHEWVEVRGAAKRAYLATDKAGETADALYLMLDNQQLARVTKPTRLWRFIPAAGNFVYAVQE